MSSLLYFTSTPHYYYSREAGSVKAFIWLPDKRRKIYKWGQCLSSHSFSNDTIHECKHPLGNSGEHEAAGGGQSHLIAAHCEIKEIGIFPDWPKKWKKRKIKRNKTADKKRVVEEPGPPTASSSRGMAVWLTVWLIQMKGNPTMMIQILLLEILILLVMPWSTWMTEREVNYTFSEVDQFELTIDPRLFSGIQSGSGAGTTTTAITTLLVGDNCHPVPPSIETQRTWATSGGDVAGTTHTP